MENTVIAMANVRAALVVQARAAAHLGSDKKEVDRMEACILRRQYTNSDEVLDAIIDDLIELDAIIANFSKFI